MEFPCFLFKPNFQFWTSQKGRKGNLKKNGGKNKENKERGKKTREKSKKKINIKTIDDTLFSVKTLIFFPV